MKKRFAAGKRALALAGLASLAVPVIAAAAMPAGSREAQTGVALPAEQYQGSVGFVTGGIGRTEAKLFERQASRHPLAIELLERHGKVDEFTADAIVKVADARGRTVLDARAGGPFMLVDLAPGRYWIQATLDNDTLKKSSVVVVRGRTSHATFEFPAHPTRVIHLSQREGVAEGGLGG
jgi:hypothetical protein